MGMIVVLYLISANVYNSVDAPSNRGFSYIEVWMIGTQIPILVAVFEYGFVLYLKKIKTMSAEQIEAIKHNEKGLRRFFHVHVIDNGPNLDKNLKKLDFVVMISSLIYFITFVSIFWTIALVK